jgi:hypothetical protein
MTKQQQQEKISLVLKEFQAGTLKSNGKQVTSKKQALAIALSQAGVATKKKDASEAYMQSYVDQFMKEEKSDGQSFSPPSSVRSAARRGLELRKKHGKGGLSTQEAGKQGIGSGVARATTLASGKSVSYAMIKRMAAFFSRHAKNLSGGEDDAGYIAGLLWGGSAGRAWANKIIKMVESAKDQ